MRDLMLDIETLGVTPGCVVLSIGAVECNNGKIVKEFHQHINVESAYNAGLQIEPRTVMWWLEQDKAAQEKLLENKGDALEEVLKDFIKAFNWRNLRVWANGASFDFPILKAAFEAVGLRMPWEFWNEMDFRTIKNLVEKKTFDTLRVYPEVAHDALDDARAQMATLHNLMVYLQERKVEVRYAA